ncbi:C-type lectin domain family 2 member A-like [Aquarana catesbeiana]|uniref:C-type lectin domain family 2 member A-like n=1 Tax=Aquarana catesbeiana TaxID=8400 RepID=UPI003CC94AD9
MEGTLCAPDPEDQTYKADGGPGRGPGICGICRSKVTIGILLLMIIVLLAVLVRGTHKEKHTTVIQCMNDWILYRDKCYYFSSGRDTWSYSQTFCESFNSSLAVIDNQQELSFLMRFKGSSNHWIGLSRNEDDTSWVWTNGSSYSEDIFQIERLQTTPKNSEHVFLNDNSLKNYSGKKPWCPSCIKVNPPFGIENHHQLHFWSTGL